MHPLVKNTIKFFLFLDCQSRQPGPAVAVADRIYGV